MLDAEAVGRTDAHALQDSVGQDGERLAVAHREQQHQSDVALVGRGRNLLAPHIVAALGPGDDIRIDADGSDAELGAHAVHRLETVDRVRACGRCEAVRARARHSAPFRQLDIGFFHDFDAFAYGQELFDVVVRQDQGHGRCAWAGAVR